MYLKIKTKYVDSLISKSVATHMLIFINDYPATKITAPLLAAYKQTLESNINKHTNQLRLMRALMQADYSGTISKMADKSLKRYQDEYAAEPNDTLRDYIEILESLTSDSSETDIKL